MFNLLAFAFVAGSVASWGGTVDRVVASIGNVAVTQNDVLAEDRLEAFLGDQHPPVVPGTADFDRVCERLIDQKLLAQEADLEGIPQVAASEVADQANEARKRYGSGAAFQAALHALGISQPQVVERLQVQERILRLVDEHLRPSVVIEESEIRAYYRDTFFPQIAKTQTDPPPLAEVEKQIGKILEERKMNQLLVEWLGQLRASYRITVHRF